MGLFDSFQTKRALAQVTDARVPGDEAAAALARLKEIGRAAVPRIIAALPDDPPAGPLTALLADLTTTASLPEVVGRGLMHSDAQVVSRVRQALLTSKKYDPNRLIEVYASGGGVLANISDILLSRKDALTPKSVMRVLDTAHRENQPVLFKLVQSLATASMVPMLISFSRSAEWEGRYCIAQTIARFPTVPVREALVRLAADPHKLVRQAAVEGLAGLAGTPELAIPAGPIAQLLRDPDLTVQTKAIEALIKLNDPHSVRYLLDVLQDESEHARRAAVEVLNAVGNVAAIKDLLLALKDQDWWVRVRAADALGAIGGPKVIDAVLGLLADPDEFMRRCAVEILNTTRDPRAFEHLLAALNDPDWWVRERALDALANIGDARAVPAILPFLEADGEATPVAIRALVSIGDASAALPISAKLASSDEAIVREAIVALEALADDRNAEAVLTALSALRNSTQLPELAEAAARAHAAIGAKMKTRRAVADAARPPAALRPAPAQARPASAPRTPDSRPAAPARAVSAPTARIESPAPPPAPPPAAPAREAAAPASAESIDFNAVLPGQVLGGRYRVESELGRGGFGVVLLVEDMMVHEHIALKVISPQIVQDEETIARFVHEVRYARRITHENVIRIHDFVTIGRTYAMSMEYFESRPMARSIRRGLHLRRQQGLKLVCDICRGIAVAHAAGIVHRDLKPANILINDAGLLKIVDFGLAAAVSHGNSRLTKTGHLVGTPTYMSPEQVRGMTVDQRTDIYSLGIIMHEVFTGIAPYAGENPLAVLYQHLEGLKTTPRTRNPEIPEGLNAAIMKAMAVNPDDRYPGAAELLRDLEALMMKEAA